MLTLIIIYVSLFIEPLWAKGLVVLKAEKTLPYHSIDINIRIRGGTKGPLPISQAVPKMGL